ncbi:MAG: hypothetical protein ABEJ24_01330 [Candidatus Magasanikbacteria bacterium]
MSISENETVEKLLDLLQKDDCLLYDLEVDDNSTLKFYQLMDTNHVLVHNVSENRADRVLENYLGKRNGNYFFLSLHAVERFEQRMPSDYYDEDNIVVSCKEAFQDSRLYVKERTEDYGGDEYCFYSEGEPEYIFFAIPEKEYKDYCGLWVVTTFIPEGLYEENCLRTRRIPLNKEVALFC